MLVDPFCIPENHLTEAKGLESKIPLREAVIFECHDSPYMGHRGIAKTYAEVRKLFYWRGMHKFVEKYVSSCKVCAGQVIHQG